MNSANNPKAWMQGAKGVRAVHAVTVAAVLVLVPLSGCFQLGDHRVVPTDYLTSDYAKWLVEVDSSSGARPSSGLLSFLDGRLTPLVHKPGGIEFFTDDALPSGPTSWTEAQLQSFASDHASFETGGDQVVTHLLFLSGHYAGDTSQSKVLGITFDYDLIVMFPDTIKGSCTIGTLCTNSDPMMQASTLHEFGHALGLVNRGVAMVKPHEDPDHKGHSSNQGSVMYWAVETSNIVSLLGGGIPQDFDSDDRTDLRSAGGA